MRLHRLQVRHDPDPHWPLDPEPTLPGFLEVTLGECSHLMFCPDVVTLLTCLWDAQQYRALGQTLRPALYESRSARVARKVARMHGTPIYVWRDGKVVALKP